MGVGQASGLAPDAQKAQLSTRSIFQLLDRTPSIDADSEAGMDAREAGEGGGG